MITEKLINLVVYKIIAVSHSWLTERGYPLTYTNAEVLRKSIEGIMPLLLQGAIVALTIRELDGFLEEVVGETTKDTLELNKANLQQGDNTVTLTE